MQKFLKGFTYAVHGIRIAFAEQLNLKVQAVAAFVVLLTGFYFNITRMEWIALVLTIALVLSLELANTALESLVDLVTIERKPLAGKVKDIAAGAVLVASFAAVVVGFLIFSTYIFQ